MGEKLGIKRGRPAKVDSKKRQLCVRFTDKELARIYMMAEEYGVSSNEAVRIAVNKLFESQKM